MENGQQLRDYVLEDKIGDGGMGEVWRAHHILLEKNVAIKVIYDHLMIDPHFRERFLREARAQAKLEHPQIVAVNDFFYEENASYLVMALIDGQSLEKRIAETQGPLPISEALTISEDILKALDYSHQRGIIHRDVKPSNILLDRAGRAYLMDFGIALAVGDERRTRTGTAIGTPHYMSPEQIRRPKTIDHRSDVYSFGCVLYEMLAGRVPFDATDEDGDSDFVIKSLHINNAPAPLRRLNPQVDEALEGSILRAMAKDPDQRFPGCGDFVRSLSDMQSAVPVSHQNLIHCPECNHPNHLPDYRPITDEKCAICEERLVPAADSSEKTGVVASGWKVASVILFVVAMLAFAGWSATYSDLDGDLRRARSALRNASSEKSGLGGQLEELQAQLEAERAVRREIAEASPLSLIDVDLYNAATGGTMIGKVTTRFKKADLKYLQFRVELRNNWQGIKSLSGKLWVKYITPAQTVDRSSKGSPPGYTLSVPVDVEDTQTIASGWGTENGGYFSVGTYRVEFWWGGKKLGDKSFYVSE